MSASETDPMIREAQQGERMIEVRIRFFTNDIAPRRGAVRPKHAWASGMIRVAPNRSHGIKAGASRYFNSLMELTSVVEKVLIEHGIMLRPDQRMKKYFTVD